MEAAAPAPVGVVALEVVTPAAVGSADLAAAIRVVGALLATGDFVGLAIWRGIIGQKEIVTADAIANALGGPEVLGEVITGPSDLALLTRRGLPAHTVTVLAERLHLGTGDLSQKLGIPQRTFTRRLTQVSLLTPSESDRTVRMARVYVIAVELIGDPDMAVGWLETPNRALGGERPLDQLDTDTGARLVEDVLGRIAYGVYS